MKARLLPLEFLHGKEVFLLRQNISRVQVESRSVVIAALAVVFLYSVFLLGGGSRPDIDSVPYLRAGSAVAAAGFLFLSARGGLRDFAVCVMLMGVLASLAVVQMIPLPPDIWSSFPDREIIRQLDSLLGLNVARPLTLSPSATGNALASLVVPVAAIFMAAAVKGWTMPLMTIVTIGVFSASLGLLQLDTSRDSPVYLYEVTNFGSAVGLFANRNHHAYFLTCCFLVSLYLFADAKSLLAKSLLAISAAFMGMMVLVTGSRGGTLTMVLAIILSMFTWRRKSRSNARGPSAIFALLCFLAPALLILSLQTSPVARLLAIGNERELRQDINLIAWEMAGEHQPWGVGFGAFEYAYRMREPIGLLSPSYVNEAHNDWLQFVIEGGAAALIILLVGLAYVVFRSLKLARRLSSDAGSVHWLGLGLMSIFALASFVDYPLRVPSLMVVATLGLAMFAAPVQKVNPAQRNRNSE